MTIASRNAERLVSLLNDFLDVERIGQGSLTLRSQPHELVPLIERAVETDLALAERAGVRLNPISRAGMRIKVNVDADRLLQVVANLLSNAIKFSPAGSTVDVAVDAVGPIARISVRDRGPGIPAAFAARVFQRFAQADATDARSNKGAGLGLAICRSLVEAMNGKIGFHQPETGGTVMTVELPLCPEECVGAMAPE